MSETNGHAPPRYRDPYTAVLGILASEWESQHRAWQAATNRAKHSLPGSEVREILDATIAATMETREAIGKRMAAVLRKHPLYPWMKAHRGFPKAAHTARLISAIGDPLRFPGRRCSNGHYLPEDYHGDACPLLVYSGEQGEESGKNEGAPCGAAVSSRRRGTGVRSVWHYCGLHVVDGRMPKQKKGQQGTWNPAVRDALLKPDVGLAAQLIRQRVEPWRSIYDEAKKRITRERGADGLDEVESSGSSSPRINDSGGGTEQHNEIEVDRGPAPEGSRPEVAVESAVETHHGLGPEDSAGGAGKEPESKGLVGASRIDAEGGADSVNEAERKDGDALRPFQIEKRARMIAVKAMIGDLLTEWRLLVLGGVA